MELEELATQVRRIMYAFDNRGSEHLEDAIQEGIITAWQALESDKTYTDRHLLNKALQKAKAFLYDAPSGRRHATGHPGGNTFTFTAPKDLPKIEKVHQFVKDYRALHGESPLPAHIARSVGVSPAFAKKYMYAGPQASGRTSDLMPTITSMDRFTEERGGDDGHSELGSMPSAEDEVMSEARFIELLSHTLPRRAQMIYLLYIVGYTQQELAKQYGVSQTVVSRNNILAGLKDIREALDAMR